MGFDAGGDKEKKTILLVEDDEENRRIIAEILTEMGQRVIDKPDVSSALLSVRSAARVDLVITDYCLPDQNGLDFGPAYKNPQFLNHPRVILSSRMKGPWPSRRRK